jgi:hypothetical protein
MVRIRGEKVPFFPADRRNENEESIQLSGFQPFSLCLLPPSSRGNFNNFGGREGEKLSYRRNGLPGRSSV